MYFFIERRKTIKKKEVLIISALIEVVLNRGVDIKKYMSKEKGEKYIETIENKFLKLKDDEILKDEWIRLLEKYIDRL